jgi:hypothetical protein
MHEKLEPTSEGARAMRAVFVGVLLSLPVWGFAYWLLS